MESSPCPQCGTRVERETTEFCPDCGYYLTWAERPADEDTGTVMTRRPGERDEPEPDPPPPPPEDPTERLPQPAPAPPPPPPEPRRALPAWALAAGALTAVALVAFVATRVWDPDPLADDTAAPTPVVPDPVPRVVERADVEAVRLSTPPTVDGNLGDWADVTVAHLLAHQVHPEFRRWEDHDDFRVTWQLGWDDSSLYVAATVEDDVHVQTQTGDQIWRGDSLDLQLNTALGEPHDLTDAVSEHHFQLILSPGDFAGLEPSAALLRGAPGGSSHFQTVDHGRLFDLAAAALTADGGFTLEAAVPWSLFDVDPHEGLVLGAALNASDNDRPGEAVQEVMVSTAPERRLAGPATWGTLTLAP